MSVQMSGSGGGGTIQIPQDYWSGVDACDSAVGGLGSGLASEPGLSSHGDGFDAMKAQAKALIELLGKLQEQLASDVKVLRSVGETMQEADEHAASCMDASE